MKRLTIEVTTQDDAEDFVYELEFIAGLLADGFESHKQDLTSTQFEFEITHITA